MAHRPDPAASGGGQTRTAERVRQGKMLGHMRYVLAISLALVCVAFAVAYVKIF